MVSLEIGGNVEHVTRVDLGDEQERLKFAGRFNGRSETVARELMVLAVGGDRAGQDEDGGGRQPSQATALVTLATEAGVELFHDDNGEPYATYTVGNHPETAPIKAKALRDWLARGYYERHRTAPSSQALQDAQTVLRGRALYEGERRTVYVRLAEHGGSIYLDLGDTDWRAVEIRPDGWRVVASEEVPVKFRRPRGMLPLPQPAPAGSLNDLTRLANTDPERPDDLTLIVGWLLGTFCLEGGRAILELNGEQGSCKTTLARMLRRIVDPCTVPLRTPPRDERDMVIAASNGLVVAIDNLSELKDWTSDALCRLSTGGGIGGRELYTDIDEVMLDAQRPCLLTGINSVATNSDLGDRTISITLPAIPSEHRRTETELRADFESAHPQLLGGLLNAVAAALANRDAVDLPRKPRLADFVAWVEAAAPALGWEPGDFLAAFEASRRNVDAVAIEAMPIGPAVLKFVAGLDEDQWQGTASQLLVALNALADEETRKDRDWPKRANRLSNQLRRIAPNLRRVGVWVGWDRSGDAGTRAIILTKNKDVWDRQDRQDQRRRGDFSRPDTNFGTDDGCGKDRQGSSGDRLWPDDADGPDDADDDSARSSDERSASGECCVCGAPLPPGRMLLCKGCGGSTENAS